jgi:hypothetical protein
MSALGRKQTHRLSLDHCAEGRLTARSSRPARSQHVRSERLFQKSGHLFSVITYAADLPSLAKLCKRAIVSLLQYPDQALTRDVDHWQV